jgi:cytoskeletal protein RodZ
MGLLILEALLALLILVGIVWWTMFSGRRKGELTPADETASQKLDSKPKTPPEQ